MDEYDIIVAGSGVSGSLAAAMASKLGSKVLLLDRNKEDEPGKKTLWGWVCGDAVAKSHIEFVKSNLGNIFRSESLGMPVDGVVALSPDLNFRIPFEGEGYSLERPEFGKDLHDAAIRNGAEFIPNFNVEAPIIEDGKVVGVEGKDKDGNIKKFRGKVIVDALGISSLLRRKLPENIYIDREIDYEDIELTGRYIYNLEEIDNDLRYYDPKYALIHLNQELAPGGYGWVFPKKGNRVNIGLGFQQKSLEIRNSKMNMKDNLKSLMDYYVKWNPALKKYSLDNNHGNGQGFWSVSVRRQMESMVFPGYIGVGDAMASPNPLSAGGIGPALIGGVIAGKVASEAVQRKDSSLESLWQFNIEYNKQYGSKMAGLEIFRIFLQSLTNDEINYGMKNFITYEEAVEISYGRVPELSLTSKITKLVKGVGSMRSFKNLVWSVDRMKELNGIYNNYPKKPADFPKFKAKVQSIINEAKARMPPNPVA